MGASHSSIDEKKGVFYVDLTGAVSPDEIQARFAAELPLPEYYGRNLDALYDVLTERGGRWDIIVYGTRAIRLSKPNYFAALERLCAEAGEETPGLRIRFFEG